MCHSSPATYLAWSLLSSLLGVFLIYHLWCFDRFNCLRWNQGTQGTFKRVMTYSYLLSVPLIITYAIGFCIIKYYEGFILLPVYGGVIPMPYQLWTDAHRKAIIPLYFCLAVAWALEMVTHLEELCFWLFVVNSGPKQRDWFNSLYFKVWRTGSAIAILYMPLVTIITRSDPLKCEAYTFLAGSLGSLMLTLWFLPVLHLFQPFLDRLRKEGVDMNTIIRLTKFHELNTIRIIFRFLFSLPLIILAVDGLRPSPHINENFFSSEFLSILAGFSLVVSSGITLVIFFPRSIESEIAAHDAGIRSRGFFGSRTHLNMVSHEQELYGTYDPEEADSKSPSPSSLLRKSVPFTSAGCPQLPPLLSPQDFTQSPLLPLPMLPSLPPVATTPPPLRDSIRLTPNRRPPSLDNIRPPPSINPDRFSNPATVVSRKSRPNLRAQIDRRSQMRW